MAAFTSELAALPTTVFANAYPRGVTVERQQFTALDRHVGTNRCVLPWAFLYKPTLQPRPLQAALAATLDTFPTLAGRVCPVKATSWLPAALQAPNWLLLCNNAGVPFNMHNSSTTLRQLVDSGAMCSRRGFTFPDAEAQLPPYMEHLDPAAVLFGEAPVVTVRLTQLEGGGSILAVTASHVVVDGRSYVRFMQQWAEHYNAFMAGIPEAVPVAAVERQQHNAVATGPHSHHARPPTICRANDRKQLMIRLTAAARAAPKGTAGSASDPSAIARVPTAQLLATAPADTVAPRSCTTAAAGVAAAGHKQISNTHHSAGNLSKSLRGHHLAPSMAAASPQTATAAEGRQADIPSALGRPQSKDFPYTPSPLFATRVLPAGWLGALKDLRAAIQQVRAEEKHIKQSLKLLKLQQTQAAGNSIVNASSDSSSASTDAAAKPSAAKPLFLAKAKVVDTRTLSTELLHIPHESLQKLKAAAGLYCQKGQYISSNDAVSSLMWLLMCHLRGRPLPGQARPPALQDTCLGLALDLRTTAKATPLPATLIASASAPQGTPSAPQTTPSAPQATPSAPQATPSAPQATLLEAELAADERHTAGDSASSPSAVLATQQAAAAAMPREVTLHRDEASSSLPMDYFGSAAWSLHVRSCTESGAAAEDPQQQIPLAWHPSVTAKKSSAVCGYEQVLAKSLAAGAVRIRGALQAMRRDANFGGKMLCQVEDSLEAPLSSQLTMTASLVHRLDAFVTAWQFGILDVTFGTTGSNPGLLMFQGLVHPVPPYHAVIMPAPHKAGSAIAAITTAVSAAASEGDDVAATNTASAAAGGVCCCITVPTCLVDSMVSSPVLHALVPAASWLSLDK